MATFKLKKSKLVTVKPATEALVLTISECTKLGYKDNTVAKTVVAVMQNLVNGQSVFGLNSTFDIPLYSGDDYDANSSWTDADADAIIIDFLNS